MQVLTRKNNFLLLLSSFVLVNFLYLEFAQAGVLLRNRRQVIRTTAPSFQQQQYQVRRSTVALRQTSARLSHRTIGTPDDQVRLIRSYNKYQDRLEKWERKRAKMRKKKEEKRKKLAERERKRKLRKAQRLRKKQERARKEAQANSSKSTGSQGAVSSTTGSRTGGLFGSGTKSDGNKKGFWRSLIESLFGKRKASNS